MTITTRTKAVPPKALRTRCGGPRGTRRISTQCVEYHEGRPVPPDGGQRGRPVHGHTDPVPGVLQAAAQGRGQPLVVVHDEHVHGRRSGGHARSLTRRHHGTVQTYIALLRGVNLGPSRRMAMADLRAWLADLGYADVRTLVQSGNVVFGAPDSATVVSRALAKRIEEGAGFAVDCVVRTSAQLRRVVEGNPFEVDGRRLAVAFLAAPLPKDRLADVDENALAPERFAVAQGRSEIYLWYANGMARSKLAAMVLPDRRLGVSATVRNWNTVTRLLEMAGP
jgi:uncharacterized protein (DUF1697 family)